MNWIIVLLAGFGICLYLVFKLEDRVAQLERFEAYRTTQEALDTQEGKE